MTPLLPLVLIATAAQTAIVDIHLPPPLAAAPLQIAAICRSSAGIWSEPVWRSHQPGFARVSVAPGRCRVLVRPEGRDAYLTSAEWAMPPRAVHLSPVWRRTLRIPAPAAAMEWQGEVDAPDVECQVEGDRARCLFVPVDAAGVVVSRAGDRVLFAIAAAGHPDALRWMNTARGRLVRVRSPGQTTVAASAVRVTRAVNTGASRLFQAEAATGVNVHRIGKAAIWIEGDGTDGWLELRGRGAATTRLRLDELLSYGSTPLEAALDPGEAIDGEIRAAGRPVEDATVIVSRVIDTNDKREPALERVAEITSGAGGRFRVEDLARRSYHVLAMHPTDGRAQTVVTAPAFPRLLLKPRAVLSGRVLENGIPVPGAAVHVVPALEALTQAANPVLLASEPAATRIDGRFEVASPDTGRVVLSVSHGAASARIDLGDAETLGQRVELGDIRLEAPIDIEFVAALPAGCGLRAAGPMGTTGLRLVELTRIAGQRWRFSAGSRGRWLVMAVCGQREVPVDPAFIDVPAPARAPIVLKVRR